MDKNFFSTQVFTADELEKLRKSAEKYLTISKKNREMDFYSADGMITETEAEKDFEFVEKIHKGL